MKSTIFLLANFLMIACSSGQQTPTLVGGPCEGCEAVLEYSDEELPSVDTLPGFELGGMPIRISGTVYQPDGKAPAKDVILYIYHTNQEGKYVPGPEATGWERRHGLVRTWIRTDEQGRYNYYTRKPVAYPSGTEPAHIHYTVLEPKGKYYWINSLLFEGDPLISDEDQKNIRGASDNVVDLKKEGDWWVTEWDIVLGKNISGY